MIAVLLQAAPAVVHDTVFAVRQQPGWQSWVDALAAVAQIVLALALLIVGLGILFAALKVKKLIAQLQATVEAQTQKLRVDLAPAIHNVTTVTENVSFVTRTVRKDVERLSESVNGATRKLAEAAAVAQDRVGEFNAVIKVVQEEAEQIFVDGVSTLRGVQAGTDTFRRFQTGELELFDPNYDDLEEYDEEEYEDDDGYGPAAAADGGGDDDDGDGGYGRVTR